VWQAQTKDPVPTVIYTAATIAFWGNRTGALPYLMPWLARGWNVVNVEYRMSGTALAPAAVKDIRCALRWAYRNAKQFHLDIDRIIATGSRREAISRSWPGMLTEDAGLDKNCPSIRIMQNPRSRLQRWWIGMGRPTWATCSPAWIARPTSYPGSAVCPIKPHMNRSGYGFS
jgi:hypothetical protein